MYPGVGSEIRVFFLCAFAGIACAFLYDVFKMIRLVCNTGVRITFVLDMLFWILTALLAFSMLLYTNYGEFRVFEAIAMLFGVCLYFLSISKPIVKGGTAALKCLFKGTFFVVKIAVFPFRTVYVRIFVPLWQKNAKKIKKIRENRLTTNPFWFKIKKEMFSFRKYSGRKRKKGDGYGNQK
ncbi:MAG: spore cortex biosynthesis protein YabQ [Clostridia bacterium]|nr:spore cortex biosynthesis protein YabQ [Clostridia bacterium]